MSGRTALRVHAEGAAQASRIEEFQQAKRKANKQWKLILGLPLCLQNGRTTAVYDTSVYSYCSLAGNLHSRRTTLW
jgi:hypothetical protein